MYTADKTMTPTIAEQLAARCDHDGQQWTTSNGEGFEDLLTEAAYGRITHDPRGGDYGTRYEFEDGSSIVTRVDAWDLGFPGHDLDCWCWPEANFDRHADDCRHATT